MSIKSTLDNNSSQKSEFPKLMRSKTSKTIVLFTDFCTGTVVYCPTNTYSIGCHSKNWVQSTFEDYNGIVNLRNK